MKLLTGNELEQITGGAVNWAVVGIAISAIVVFLSGVIEGITNPGRCDS